MALALEPAVLLMSDFSSPLDREDLVLVALARAPVVEISDEEVEELHAREAGTGRWIPHDEFVAGLDGEPDSDDNDNRIGFDP